MSTNFGFGNLTVNGQKIDWNIAKKYDADGDGNLSTSEYNALLKEMDGDGFNGVPAFGKVDANSDGKVTQAELVEADQKVQIGDYVDAYFEQMANTQTTTTDGSTNTTTGGVTADFKTASTAFMNNFISTFLADKNNAGKTSQMCTDFQAAFATFVTEYQEVQAKLADAKAGDTTSAAMYEAVDAASANGNISNTETAAVKTAAKDYAVEKAISGDFSFLSSLGYKTTQLVTLKTLVAALSTSATPDAALDAVKSEVAKLVAAAAVTKIVSASATLEAAAKEKASTVTTDSYSVDALSLDYSSIDGYDTNATKSVKGKGKNAEKENAKADIEKLRTQMKAQIQAKCKTEGTTFNEDLFTSIFDASKENSVNACVTGRSGSFSHSSKSSYKVQDLVSTFVSTFNATMSDTIAKMAEDKKTSDGVPTQTTITTDLLDDSSSSLTKEEQALKALQETLLTKGDVKLAPAKGALAEYFATIAAKGTAEEIIDTLTSGIKTRMKTNLGSKYNENKANNIIAQAKNETLQGVTGNTTMSQVVTSFMASFETKYSSLKTTTDA